MKPSILIAGALAFGLASAALAEPPADSGGGRAAVRQACGADIHKYCPDARPGPGGGIRDCIKKHHASFSGSCQAALAQMRAARRRNGGSSPALP